MFFSDLIMRMKTASRKSKGTEEKEEEGEGWEMTGKREALWQIINKRHQNTLG